MRKLIPGLVLAGFLAGLLLPMVGAQDELDGPSPCGPQKIRRIPLADGEGVIRGRALIVSNASGPDSLFIKTRGLDPNTVVTVFLTHSPTAGALPAQFVGQFKTNANGKGKFQVRTEVCNAFASANQCVADSDGIANPQPGEAGFPAGALGNGANTIPLNFIRLYLGEGTISVFGTGESNVGGGLLLTGTRSID